MLEYDISVSYTNRNLCIGPDISCRAPVRLIIQIGSGDKVQAITTPDHLSVQSDMGR